MAGAGVMKEKFRLFGGNVVAVSLCDNAYNGLCKAHGKHLRKAADVVSAIVTEANDICVISGRYRRSTAEKRSVGIFAGGVDRVGPGLDRLGLMIGHIKVVKAADKGRFSTAGTPDKDYLAGFDLFGKPKAAVIFLAVFGVNKGGVDGIFFGQKNTSERIVCLQPYFIL